MLLLCALIAGSGSAWAEEETVASGTFDGKNGTYTEGWSTTGTGKTRNDCIVLYSGENITSPTFNLAQYNSVTISIKARRFGTLTGSKATIDASINSTSVGTVDATGTSATASLSDITFTPTSSMTAVTVVFTCTNATASNASQTGGAGINTITIKGTKPDGTATTTTIVSTGITNTYINKSTAAGQLSFTVTETDGGAAVDGATVTWDSSNKSVATIAADGTVTLVGVGSTDLTATYAGDATYAASSAKYVLNVTDSRADAELLVEDDFEMEVTTTIAITDLYLMESDGEVTVTSASPAVVKVEDGLLKALAVGTAVITVSVAATDDYAAASDQITVTVTAKEAVEPVGPAGSAGKFVKVTSTSDITDGDYLIVYETDGVAFNGELETLDAAYNVISVTISNGEIAETSDNLKAVFTIDTTNGTLKSASGYYIGVSTNSNGLKQTDDADTYQHTFGIDSNGNASIASSFTGSNRILLFNSSTSSGNYRFRYYGSTSSTNKAIQLYKYVPGTSGESFDVTIGSAGYKTLVSSVDFATKTGTTAYIVTASSASSATLTSVSEVPAGTPVILKGSGTVTLDVIDNAATVNGNLLQVSTESTGNGVYVLANKNDVVGFYLWKGGSLGAGRVYLPAPATGAREFIGFGDEATGIKDYSREATTNNRCYNLNGQRVDVHQKGLYIVNGKKVIIK